MPWAIMIRFLWAFFVLIQVPAVAQWLGGAYGLGYHLAIHPQYPNLDAPTHSTAIYIEKKANRSKWSLRHYHPYIGLTAAWQSTSNRSVMGDAFHVAATIRYPLLEREKWMLSLGGGIGIAYVSQIYDALNNPTNIVMGAHLNAVALLRVRYDLSLTDRLTSFVALQYAHYSNSRLRIPNIGMNIPQLCFGFGYRIDRPNKPIFSANLSSSTETLDSIPNIFSPFIRFGLGMTEIGGTRGPTHPSYCIELGVQRIMTDISKLTLSIEYLYDWSTFRFINNQTKQNSHWDFARMSIQVGHELMFGHLAFVTIFGVYLNNHAYRRSIILTKIGMQWYLHSYFKKIRHQIMLGAFIRSYAGEAERFEIVLGYHF